MEKAKAVIVRSQADLEPTDDPAKLKRWWKRGTAFYSAYRVKRIERQQKGDVDILTFRLARNEALGTFQVDLAQGGKLAWAELPSTAQLATEERPYGFLFLSDEWAADATLKLAANNLTGVDIKSLQEGGGKWPIAGELEPLEHMLRFMMQDPDMKAKLANVFDTLAKSVR